MSPSKLKAELISEWRKCAILHTYSGTAGGGMHVKRQDCNPP